MTIRVTPSDLFVHPSRKSFTQQCVELVKLDTLSKQKVYRRNIVKNWEIHKNHVETQLRKMELELEKKTCEADTMKFYDTCHYCSMCEEEYCVEGEDDESGDDFCR